MVLLLSVLSVLCGCLAFTSMFMGFPLPSFLTLSGACRLSSFLRIGYFMGVQRLLFRSRLYEFTLLLPNFFCWLIFFGTFYREMLIFTESSFPWVWRPKINSCPWTQLFHYLWCSSQHCSPNFLRAIPLQHRNPCWCSHLRIKPCWSIRPQHTH